MWGVLVIVFFVMGQQVSDCITFPPGDSLWPRDRGLSSSSSGRTKGKSLSGQEVVAVSDLRPLDRRIWIITTAALPWMTGTSVNPLLRAAYLAKTRPTGKITLMVPWLEPDEQKLLFKLTFDEPDQQLEYMYQWLRDAGLATSAERLDIRFYTGRYHDEFCSIFPMGDITDMIPDDEADVCILEEPEHLNWYRAPFKTKPWTEKFKHVVGIIHTNYLVYAGSIKGGYFKEQMLYYVNQGMCRAYTHKIVKLSNALQDFAPEKETTSAVHGVREHYLKQGDESVTRSFGKGVYFVGKLAWPKGLDNLFKFMKVVQARTGDKCFHVDIFGSGPHEEDIHAAATKAALPVTFHGAQDHSVLTDHKVFVNPSISEVLCTTVIEALAMGKWVVCPRHPSNEFFYQFPNCLTYETAEEFAANVYWALSTDPRPLSPELRYELTWEAATDRLIQACMITTEMAANAKVVSDRIALWVHDVVSGSAAGDVLRKLGGGRTASGQLDFMKKYATSEPRSANDLSTMVGEVDLGDLDTSVEGTPVVVADGMTSETSPHKSAEDAPTF